MCTNVHHTKMGPPLEARGRCQPEPCSFAPSHSLLLNDPQWEALKSRKERNIASGQQANHFPPCSPPPTHTSFSKTSPRDPLPSGFSFSQTAVVGSHGREAAWSPPWGKRLHSRSPGHPCISQSLSLAQQVLCSKLSVSSPDLCWVQQDTLAGTLWHLCSCLSFPVFLPPPRAHSTLLLTQLVQPLVLLCFFHSIQLRVLCWLVTRLLYARLVCVPPEPHGLR